MTPESQAPEKAKASASSAKDEQDVTPRYDRDRILSEPLAIAGVARYVVVGALTDVPEGKKLTKDEVRKKVADFLSHKEETG